MRMKYKFLPTWYFNYKVFLFFTHMWVICSLRVLQWLTVWRYSELALKSSFMRKLFIKPKVYHKSKYPCFVSYVKGPCLMNCVHKVTQSWCCGCVVFQLLVSLKNNVIGLCLNSGDTNTSKKLKVDENSKYIITLVDRESIRC